MRYNETRKQETRARVLQAAARTLRVKGPHQLGVAEVMAEAGLTHGGFYAHFKSKDDLLGAAIDEAFSAGRGLFRRATDGKAPREALLNYIDRYVSMVHRDAPERGCPIAALTSDLPRLPEPARQIFDDGVRGLVRGIAERLPFTLERAEAEAGSILSEMVGALGLARAVSDTVLAETLLAQSRANLRARIDAAFAAGAMPS